MNKILKNNIEALVAYSNTDRYQKIWEQSNSVEYLSERSKIFLEIYNTFEDRLKNPSEEATKELISLLTKREFFIHLVNEGVASTMKSIAGGLQLKEDIKEKIELPKFNISDKEYQYCYDTAKNSYMESFMYHKRRQDMDENYAKHGFYEHWFLLGEVFNTIIAQDYVKELKNKQTNDIPLIFKQTISGDIYMEDTNVIKHTHTRYNKK